MGTRNAIAFLAAALLSPTASSAATLLLHCPFASSIHEFRQGYTTPFDVIVNTTHNTITIFDDVVYENGKPDLDFPSKIQEVSITPLMITFGSTKSGSDQSKTDDMFIKINRLTGEAWWTKGITSTNYGECTPATERPRF